jgi:restriction system protein
MIGDVAEEQSPTPEIELPIRPLLDALLDLAVQLWWLWLIVLAVFVVRLLLFLREERKAYERRQERTRQAQARERELERSGIREVDVMDGTSFERYLRTMFQRLGYRVEHVGNPLGDYGGDLVIEQTGTRTVVQAKRYGSRLVGIKAVQEAHAAKAMYDCSHAMVVTNSVFSQQARRLASKTGVELWDRTELTNRLPGSQVAPQADAGAESASPANCARCGDVVSEKVHAYCIAHPERFGGLVYCYTHQRGFRHRAS